jgi:hypothetical protein
LRIKFRLYGRQPVNVFLLPRFLLARFEIHQRRSGTGHAAENTLSISLPARIAVGNNFITKTIGG